MEMEVTDIQMLRDLTDEDFAGEGAFSVWLQAWDWQGRPNICTVPEWVALLDLDMKWECAFLKLSTCEIPCDVVAGKVRAEKLKIPVQTLWQGREREAARTERGKLNTSIHDFLDSEDAVASSGLTTSLPLQSRPEFCENVLSDAEAASTDVEMVFDEDDEDATENGLLAHGVEALATSSGDTKPAATGEVNAENTVPAAAETSRVEAEPARPAMVLEGYIHNNPGSWGPFTFSLKKPGSSSTYGGYECTCPFHRCSSKTACKKMIRVLGPSDKVTRTRPWHCARPGGGQCKPQGGSIKGNTSGRPIWTALLPWRSLSS